MRKITKTHTGVIVFIPSEEEDKDRITCGNSLIALEGKTDFGFEW